VKKRRALAFATLTVVGWGLSSGVSACTDCSDIGCIQNVTVTPEQPISGDGDYEATFVADGKTYTCTLTLPSTGAAKCSNLRAYVQHDKHGIEWLSLDGDYSKLAVTITRDGTEIANQTFSVKYEGQELNGSGCGECLSAAETLKLE
jgi:hypothetical protein